MRARTLLLATVAVGAACAASQRTPPVMTTTYGGALAPADSASAGKITVDSLLETLTLRERVGQVIMPWLLGNYAAFESEEYESLAVWIDSVEVGGIIISVGSPLDVAAKLNALQRRSRQPLLIAADLEWGAGMRLRGATSFPMPMAVGATGRELDAYELGRVTALEARAVGIHLTFSPVADLNNNPRNPIINTRSFGEDPRQASTLLAAYVQGAREHGLFTTAKHFPGHGDTDRDSHIELPVVPGCWERLDTLELVPFRAAIDAGVTAVMTAHVAMPCVDGTPPPPATLSPAVMTDMLRDSLGFDGVVVTDALAMGAIVARYGAGETAVRAFEAGSDILLMPADVRVARDAMVDAVLAGRIPHERLERSVRRLLTLKEEAGLFARRTVSLDSVPTVVGRHDFREIADDIAARSLTLVQTGPLDRFRGRRGRTAVVTYAEETNLSIADQLLREMRLHGEATTSFRLYPASGPASYDSARTHIAGYPRVLFAVSVRFLAGRGHVDLPAPLADLLLETDRAKPTVLASLGSPYLLEQLPGFGGGYLLAWSDVPATERAVARAVFGGARITGKLPITLSTYPRGYGVVWEGSRQ